MAMNTRNGFRFTPYEAPEQTPFERLFEIFQELITHTSGDFDEAIDWLRELDKEYELTDDDYTIDDFIEELKAKGYIREEFKDGGGEIGDGQENCVTKIALEHGLLPKEYKKDLSGVTRVIMFIIK